jgi:hypothetical protein
LNVNIIENYGVVRVLRKGTNQPLSKVYVKVYAKSKSGSTSFYKDGYTDLTGKFNYATLSTNDLDNTERFSILVMSDDLGSEIYESAPPKM